MEGTRLVTLPSGRTFDPGRPRSHGVLDREEFDYCLSAGIPLGYDPAQNGWVSMLGEDDFLDPRAVSRPQIAAAAGILAEARVAFRKWRLEDAPLYRRYLDNPRIWRFLPEQPPSPFTEEVARALIEAAQVESHHDVAAVELDGMPIGQVRIQFDNSFPDLKAAEVSYWIAEEHWGKRLGAVILRAFTRRSFERWPLDLIYAWIRLEHSASIKTAERAGYQRDPNLGLDSVARDPRRAGCGRWLCFRSSLKA